MSVKVNLTSIAAQVAEKLDMSQKDAVVAVTSVFETITESLVEGNQVSISNFGSFVTKERPARVGRNPQTGDPIEIEARSVASFKASQKLKDAVKDA